MRLVFISFVLLTTFFLNAKAQDGEIIQLTPYPVYLEKKRIENERIREENRHSICYYFGELLKPSKIKAKITIEIPLDKSGIIANATTTIKEVVFQDKGGIQTARLEYFARIISKDRSVDGVFEEQIDLSVAMDDLTTNFTTKQNSPINFKKTIKLAKGKYILDFRLIDCIAGNRTIKRFSFEIK